MRSNIPVLISLKYYGYWERVIHPSKQAGESKWNSPGRSLYSEELKLNFTAAMFDTVAQGKGTFGAVKNQVSGAYPPAFNS